MKKVLQSFALLMALLVPVSANAAYVQLADGVYQDGMALYIGSGVTSLGDLQVNPSVIYCYAAIPPACASNTFTGYNAALHVASSAMVSYFSAQYWYNFSNITGDAVEPQSVTMNTSSAELGIGEQLSLSAAVAPANATPQTVYWSSTNTSVATVNSNGVVTAVALGECYIRAICVDKQAYCHVTVVPERVTVTLNQHEARLLPNHTMTLNVTTNPATTDLVVSSSNSAVALPRYVNGSIMVMGVTEGSATITVSTSDGWCVQDACNVTVYTEDGDVNCDGYVTISDVTNIIDYILGDYDSLFNVGNADTNGDGTVSISDVTSLIDYLLSGYWPGEEPEDPEIPGTETFTVNGVTFKMVGVEGGTFTMGASDDDTEANSWEKPAHQVTLSSFSIGQTEVTQELWQAVMGSNPSYFTGNLQRPVESVSWNDCQTFISRLNDLTGKNFRLPTEAEWEYAARGGNKSQGYKYAGSNDINTVAWYWYNIPSQSSGTVGYGTQPVATRAHNELGLYDMSGNVWEWCQDWYGSYSSGAQTNPTGPSTGSLRVLRGGSWGLSAGCCRVSYRLIDYPTSTDYDLGLRLAF